MASSLLTPIPSKPQSLAPKLKPLNLDFIYGHELATNLKLQNFNYQLDDIINKVDNFKNPKHLKRVKRPAESNCDGSNIDNAQAFITCLNQCISQYYSDVNNGVAVATALATYYSCENRVFNAFESNEDPCVAYYFWSKYRDPKRTEENRVQSCFNVLRYISWYCYYEFVPDFDLKQNVTNEFNYIINKWQEGSIRVPLKKLKNKLLPFKIETDIKLGKI